MELREEVPAVLAGERVDRFVALLTGRTRAEVNELIAAGRVMVAGRAPARSRKLAAGEIVDVDLPDDDVAPAPRPEPVAYGVVHESPSFIVVDKPAGLVVHPGSGNVSGTLVNGLVHRYPELAGTEGVGDPQRPGIVHRLDAGTSGLVVVARTAAAYTNLVAQLAARTVERRYVALVVGEVEADAGLVDAPVGRGDRDRTRMTVAAAGREARTRYEVVERFREPLVTTLLECRLETGRTHQIRVHMAAIGHPVAGDLAYGGSAGELQIARPFLHAGSLAFDDPDTGERVSFTSPLPDDLAAALRLLRRGAEG